MSSRKKYSSEYKVVRKMFWDGKDEAGNQYYLNRDGVALALSRALKDYTSRTSKKKDSEIIASVKNMMAALPAFIDRFMEYFSDDSEHKTSPSKYDKWHHEMCELFIKCITTANIRQTVTYGKAQKIVNMTMKTIFCLEGAEAYNDRKYFAYCHMPLDSILLDWFRKYVADQWYNPDKKRTEKIKISQEGGPLPKWSGLEYKPDSIDIAYEAYSKDPNAQYFNKHYHYMFFVTMIRKYFDKGNSANRYDGLTPLEAEFYIWPEMQYEQAAKALVAQDLVNKLMQNPNVSVNNDTIQGLNKQLCVLLAELSKFY